MLKRGSKGRNVVELQASLKALGLYDGALDGIFGRRTELALTTWQCRTYATGEIGLVEMYCLAREHVLRPSNRRELDLLFGHIEYRDRERGWVTITNDFARKYIVRVELPIVGRKAVHFRLRDKFIAALREIDDAGLAQEIKRFGTWACRHICNNPKKALSLHAYGIAVDINWKENPYGQRFSKIHPEVTAAFVRRGFRTIPRDPMHYQFYGE